MEWFVQATAVLAALGAFCAWMYSKLVQDRKDYTRESLDYIVKQFEIIIDSVYTLPGLTAKLRQIQGHANEFTLEKIQSTFEPELERMKEEFERTVEHARKLVAGEEVSEKFESTQKDFKPDIDVSKTMQVDEQLLVINNIGDLTKAIILSWDLIRIRCRISGISHDNLDNCIRTLLSVDFQYIDGKLIPNQELSALKEKMIQAITDIIRDFQSNALQFLPLRIK